MQANEIINRLNEISFNSSLIAEMRAIDFVRRLIDENRLDEKKYKRINMHMIPAPSLEYHLNASSKLNTDMAFLEFLRDRGRAAAEAWIKQNKAKIGVTSSIDIAETFPRSRSPARRALARRGDVPYRQARRLMSRRKRSRDHAENLPCR